MNCEKCGRYLVDYPQAARLRGGLVATLCVPCLNAWDEHFRSLPVAEELQLLTDKSMDIQLLTAAGEITDPSEALRPIRARVRAIEAELWAAGKAFVKGATGEQ